MRTRFTGQAGAVRQQFFNGDWRIIGVGGLDLEPRQVLRYRVIQSQLALLPQLHDGRRGEELAVRCHAELRLRRHRHLLAGIRKAEPGRPNQFLIGHHADGDPGQVAIEDLALQPGAEQPLGPEHLGVARHARAPASAPSRANRARPHQLPSTPTPSTKRLRRERVIACLPVYLRLADSIERGRRADQQTVPVNRRRCHREFVEHVLADHLELRPASITYVVPSSLMAKILPL